MIDLNEYKLKYVCRKTEKTFLGKTIVPSERVALVNPETLERKEWTIGKLRANFRGSKENRKTNKENFHKPFRVRHRFAKNPDGHISWEDYLNGAG